MRPQSLFSTAGGHSTILHVEIFVLYHIDLENSSGISLLPKLYISLPTGQRQDNLKRLWMSVQLCLVNKKVQIRPVIVFFFFALFHPLTVHGRELEFTGV